jgi:phosphoglycerol geranylgeranyltransferase
LGYIIVSPGGTAGFISQANEIPFDKPEAATIYALAAQYMGMRFVYLERGSGVEAPISQAMIKMTKKALNDAKLIVGGGIRRREQAREVALAGADIIVTGTVLEEKSLGFAFSEILAGIEEGVNARKA